MPPGAAGAGVAGVLGPSRTAIWPWRDRFDRLAQDPGRLLWRMEAGGVLGFDEVQQELRLALQSPRLGEHRVGGAAVPGALDVADEAHDRVHRPVAKPERPPLNLLDAPAQLLLVPLVAGLARAIDVEQRAPHVVIADLERADALVRHVAVGARDTRSRVNALVPHLELGMLRLQHRRTALGVRPVVVRVLGVIGEDIVRLQSLRPRVDEAFLGALEVILDMALAADEGAHLLTAGVAVHVVVRHSL